MKGQSVTRTCLPKCGGKEGAIDCFSFAMNSQISGGQMLPLNLSPSSRSLPELVHSSNPYEFLPPHGFLATTCPQFGDFLFPTYQLVCNQQLNGSNQVDPKPNFSYIGLIAKAILSSKERRMVLSEIYEWIQINYSYFRSRGPGWRNSIRHNLSLNDCFIKVGRSSNGKGHYWGIHFANLDDFLKGDFRRRRAQRKVRLAMGLACSDDHEDSDSSSVTPRSLPNPYSYPEQDIYSTFLANLIPHHPSLAFHPSPPLSSLPTQTATRPPPSFSVARILDWETTSEDGSVLTTATQFQPFSS